MLIQCGFCGVLILPMRDWNKFWKNFVNAWASRSDLTYEELKLQRHSRISWANRVFILPMRNWNLSPLTVFVSVKNRFHPIYEGLIHFLPNKIKNTFVYVKLQSWKNFFDLLTKILFKKKDIVRITCFTFPLFLKNLKSVLRNFFIFYPVSSYTGNEPNKYVSFPFFTLCNQKFLRLLFLIFFPVSFATDKIGAAEVFCLPYSYQIYSQIFSDFFIFYQFTSPSDIIKSKGKKN